MNEGCEMRVASVTAWIVTMVAVAVLAFAIRLPRAVATAAEGDVDAGERVFDANCAMCHGTDASGMMGMHPSLRGAVERLSLEGVQVTVRNGRNTTPPMPAFADRLTKDQLDDVVAYIASLPVGPRNFGPGQQPMGEGRDLMEGRDMMDGPMGGGGMMTGLALLWLLFVLVLLALAVAALIWLVRNLRSPASGGASHPNPSAARAELDRRYATGELSRDEYLQRRADLGG